MGDAAFKSFSSSDFFYGKIAERKWEILRETAKIFDGNLATSCTLTPAHQVDDYVGIDMGRVVPVYSIEIFQAANDEGDASQGE